jgi:hypothetical protein
LAGLLLLGVGGSLILQRPDKMITARTFSLSIYPDGDVYIFFPSSSFLPRSFLFPSQQQQQQQH